MRRLSWKLHEKKKVAQQENKQAAVWPCGLFAGWWRAEKKQTTALDRWWKERTDGWRKYKAQYWFFWSPVESTRMHAAPLLALLSSGMNTWAFSPSLSCVANGSWCKLCPCALKPAANHLLFDSMLFFFAILKYVNLPDQSSYIII